MAQRFVSADRDQKWLLPPSMRDWLADGHLAWFVIELVDELDLHEFAAVYRQDGQGRPPFDPAVMVALLIYNYCVGVRSSRQIERRCMEDVATRVVAGGLQPDHVTIARFRSRHQDALAGLFSQVLGVCARAGLVQAGTVAIDGTKVLANASLSRSVTIEGTDLQGQAAHGGRLRPMRRESPRGRRSSLDGQAATSSSPSRASSRRSLLAWCPFCAVNAGCVNEYKPTDFVPQLCVHER